MKVLIISDIHGDYKTLCDILNKESFDKLIILGDLLEYGIYTISSNNQILNEIKKYKNKLVLIKGNCDYMIDYNKFDLCAHEEISLTINKHIVTFSHGHIYNNINLPSYHGDIFISGHTHVPSIERNNNIIFANPGSLGKPRYGLNKSYMIFENNSLIVKTINGSKIKSLQI